MKLKKTNHQPTTESNNMKTNQAPALPAYKKQQTKQLKRGALTVLIAVVLTPLLGKALAAALGSLATQI
jgi:hypothetical protein